MKFQPPGLLLGVLVLLLAAALAASPTRAQDPAAERLLREAERLESGGDPSAALEELELLVQQFPGDRLAPRALVEIIQLRHLASDGDGTRAALERLLAEYPRTVESAAAFILQGEMESDAAAGGGDLEEARKTFRRVPLLYGRETWPRLPERTRARIRSGEISLLLGDAEAAAAEFLAAVEDEPPSPWVGRARLRLGAALLALGDWAAAAEILARLAAEKDPPTESALVPVAATSSEDDRRSAGRLLSFLHRHLVRPAAGEKRWLEARRFPLAGTTLEGPSGVAAGEDGRVLVVDRRARLMALVDAEGQVLVKRGLENAGRPGAGRPGWSADGAPWVVTADAVEPAFAGPRTSFTEPQTGKELKGLVAAERGVFGHWFVVAKGWKSLLAFRRGKGRELLATQRPELEDLAQDNQGRLYGLDRRARHVVGIDLDRNWQGVVVQGGNWKRPVAVAVDRLGQIYVLDRGTRTVHVYGGDGRRLTSLGPLLGGGIELRAPADLAVDGRGRLFIADEKLPSLIVLE